MALPREAALDSTQIDEMMASLWNMRVASIGPRNRINLTPMWFGWAGGRIYFYGRVVVVPDHIVTWDNFKLGRRG